METLFGQQTQIPGQAQMTGRELFFRTLAEAFPPRGQMRVPNTALGRVGGMGARLVQGLSGSIADELQRQRTDPLTRYTPLINQAIEAAKTAQVPIGPPVAAGPNIPTRSPNLGLNVGPGLFAPSRTTSSGITEEEIRPTLQGKELPSPEVPIFPGAIKQRFSLFPSEERPQIRQPGFQPTRKPESFAELLSAIPEGPGRQGLIAARMANLPESTFIEDPGDKLRKLQIAQAEREAVKEERERAFAEEAETLKSDDPQYARRLMDLQLKHGVASSNQFVNQALSLMSKEALNEYRDLQVGLRERFADLREKLVERKQPLSLKQFESLANKMRAAGISLPPQDVTLPDGSTVRLQSEEPKAGQDILAQQRRQAMLTGKMNLYQKQLERVENTAAKNPTAMKQKQDKIADLNQQMDWLQRALDSGGLLDAQTASEIMAKTGNALDTAVRFAGALGFTEFEGGVSLATGLKNSRAKAPVTEVEKSLEAKEREFVQGLGGVR